MQDFLESSGWPVRSLDLVAMIESEEAAQVRALPDSFRLPCQLRLGCRDTLLRAEEQRRCRCRCRCHGNL